MADRELSSLCPYCGVGCGLRARAQNGRLTQVRGDPDYPVNHGRTCRKPLELAAAVHAADRALVPLQRLRRDAGFIPTTWDEAMAATAARLRRIAAEHGPDALGFYISGQLLTEDYYAVNKLVKGFLGTNNLDSNSRLCMSSAVAGYTGAFGSDGPPGAYADIELADCFLLLGSNTAACHPILFSRIRDRQREGAYVICVDPRPTQTTQAADLHLAVAPGTDLPLLNAMLCVIDAEGLLDERFVSRRTTGFAETIETAREWPPARAAEVCGIEEAQIVQAANRFGGAGAAMALWSMGANQSTVGTAKNRALINLCLATGNISRPGAGPFSLTGQPNAMGGRETGGLAHLLPGYRKVTSAEDRAAMAAHWQLPADLPGISATPGLAAVELFEAAAAGKVKALWIAATNPVVSMPDADLVRAALARAELVVVQDAHVPTETSALADVVLPAAAWPEKQGTMTNSERRVGLVRRLLPAPGEALADWRIFARLGAALGYGEHFAWREEAEVFDEFARSTAGRLCDVSGLSHARLQREGGIQWRGARLYENHRFPTPDGRARFAPTPHTEPAETPDQEYPLWLTTGRVADQWHTMSRTGKSAQLRASSGEAVLEMCPADARSAGIGDGELARVSSRRGELRLPVKYVAAMSAGVAFAPFHWGALHAQPGAGALNTATNRATDPVSLQPELKALAIRVEPARGLRPVRRGDRKTRRRLVVVGTGMAGLAVAEEAVRRRSTDELQVTLLGEEPDLPYNRILVSKLLAGSCGSGELELRPRGWFAKHGIDLRRGAAAMSLTLEDRTVTDSAGERHVFDALVIATGSRPFFPPIPGADYAHVHGFRTTADADALARAVKDGARRAVVLGGGLLGLEAAAGLHARGAAVTVVERAERLMPQQLDAGGASILDRRLAQLGIRALTARSVAGISAGHVTLQDGTELGAELVVIAAGVVPEVTLAKQAGIDCNRGIVVDDELRTDQPSVWAAGECAEHRGTVYGLWAPLAEQARVAGAVAVGDPASFHGATTATTLKVAGVELFAGGRTELAAGEDEVLASDTRRGRYRRLLLKDDRLMGAILLGDTTGSPQLSGLLRGGEPVPEALLDAAAPAAEAAEDPEAIVCSCNSVKRREILGAVRRGGLSTVAQIGNATRAGTGCGGCARELEGLLRSGTHDARGIAPKAIPQRDRPLGDHDSSARNMRETTTK